MADAPRTMSAEQFHDARRTLGEMWGLDRPLRMAEMGRVLGLKGRDPGETIRGYERGSPITGPVALAVEALLSGWKPADLESRLSGD